MSKKRVQSLHYTSRCLFKFLVSLAKQNLAHFPASPGCKMLTRWTPWQYSGPCTSWVLRCHRIGAAFPENRTWSTAAWLGHSRTRTLLQPQGLGQDQNKMLWRWRLGGWGSARESSPQSNHMVEQRSWRNLETRCAWRVHCNWTCISLSISMLNFWMLWTRKAALSGI